MESRGPGDSKNVKTSQAYFFEGFISFFEDFSLTNCDTMRSPQINNRVSSKSHYAGSCGFTSYFKKTQCK